MSTDNNSFCKCVMCFFMTDSDEKLRKHINRYHRHDPSFRAFCKYCSYQSTSWTAWRKHLTRCELKEDTYNNESETFDIQSDDSFEFQSSQSENTTFDFVLASFFLRLQAKHGLSQNSVNIVVEEIEALLSDIKEKISEKIHKVLEEDPQNIEGSDLFNQFDIDNISNKFGSADKRKKFYERYFRMVSPQSVFINSETKRVNNRMMHVNNYGYYIPFLSSLQALLEMPEVSYWVLHNHKSSDNILRDWSDGEVLKEESLTDTLLIILNIDDIETVNPIGMSKTIHKLTVISYELANIPAQFRSALHTKQLIAICKSKLIRKSGLKNLLFDFVESMNKLKNGFLFKIKDKKKPLKAILVATPADTPAANQLWGFKEGVGKAYRCCRTCDGIRPNIFTHFTEDAFSIRDTEEHLERCEIIEEVSTVATKNDLCKKYGINTRSPLFDIQNVSLIAAVHDPMHVLLEGIVLIELKAMLQYFILVDKLFSLDWLNAELNCWNYPDNSSKPPVLQLDSLKDKNKLTLNASTVLTLIVALPFILSKKVIPNNSKFLNFLRIIKIVHICTSPYVESQTPTELAFLIKKHHEVFVEEYPNVSITPKFHYLVHFPRQMKNFGPLRHQWCMRWEAHFTIFKGRKWKSFKNIAFSMASHHQLWMCYHQLGIMGERNPNYLYKGHIFNLTEKVDFVSFTEDEQNSISTHLNVNEDIWTAKEVSYHGCTYRAGMIVPEGNNFLFIDLILLQEETIYFLVKSSIYSNFVNNLNAFEVEFNSNRMCIDLNTVRRKFPMRIYEYYSKKYVVNPYQFKVYGE